MSGAAGAAGAAEGAGRGRFGPVDDGPTTGWPRVWPALGPDGGPVGPVVLTRPGSRPALCDHDPAAAWAHSWDPDGVRACWRPDPVADGSVVAIDLERVDRPLPPGVAARIGTTDPLAAWTHWCTLEVLAKISGRPLHRLLRHPDEAAAVARTVRLHTVERAGRLLCLGTSV